MGYYTDRKTSVAAAAIIIALLVAAGLFFALRKTDDIKDLRYEQISDYEKILTHEPGNTDILVKIGSLYKSTGEIDKAIRYLTKALEIDPENYGALNELGHAYALKGDYDRAIDTFLKAKKLPVSPT